MSGIVYFTLFAFLAVQIINVKADDDDSSSSSSNGLCSSQQVADIISSCYNIPFTTDATISEYYFLSADGSLKSIRDTIINLESEVADLRDDIYNCIDDEDSSDYKRYKARVAEVTDELICAYNDFLQEVDVNGSNIPYLVRNKLNPALRKLQNMCNNILNYVETSDRSD